jgi:hypothetical protein
MHESLISDTMFDNIFNGGSGGGLFEFQVAVAPIILCPYALAFAEFADRLCEPEIEGPSIVGVNQAILQLTKKYFEWFNKVPKRHQYHLSENGHTCIFQVFVEAYEKLSMIELTISPPKLYIPPKPPPPAPPPPPPKIAGIFLGEDLE